MMALHADVASCPGSGSDADGWREIPGCAGIYFASRDGKIKSIDRIQESSNQFGTFFHTRRGKLLTKQITADGYHRVCLHIGKGKHTRLVHHLIALAFIGERQSGITVNHKDGNKLNNHVDNLEYATLAENVLHARRLLKVGIHLGSKNGNSKLSEELIDAIRIDNRLQRVIADEYGMTQSSISKIKLGIYWRHVK